MRTYFIFSKLKRRENLGNRGINTLCIPEVDSC